MIKCSNYNESECSKVIDKERCLFYQSKEWFCPFLSSMTQEELKKLRESFDFTQKQMADIVGVHPNAYQRFEYGTSPIPRYIRNYAMSLTILHENKLFKKHIVNIGLDSENFKS